MTEGIGAVTGLLAGLSGIALGWLAFGRQRGRDARAEVRAFTRLEVLLEELGQKVGRLGELLTGLGQDLNGHEKRIAVLEQRVNVLERALLSPRLRGGGPEN